MKNQKVKELNLNVCAGEASDFSDVQKYAPLSRLKAGIRLLMMLL